MEAPSGYPDVPPSRPSAAAGMAAADPALGMAAIMENQVEEMRKLLSRFKVCANPAAAGVGADVDAGALPGHADILIFGPSGSGKSSLIRTFYMALHKTQQVPADFADRIIVKDTAMNEGTLKYISAVIKPAKLDHRGNILSSSILCHDTRGQIWMDEREQKQLSVIMDGNVKDDSMVQQRNYRYARLLWEFWKRDSELFPPEILANKRGVHNQPHAVLFVFDGSMEEIPDGEEETKFYREIIQMCREKGYTNPQAASGVEYEPRGIAMDAWDPLADPADVDAPGKADPTKELSCFCVIDVLSVRGDCSAVDDASMLAIAGPLGREAVLSSTRMRDVEDWISRAEASGLDVEQILPARQHLRSLAKQNPTIHWEKRESQATADLVDGTKAGEAEARLQAAEQQVNLLLSDKSSLSAAGNKAMQDAAEQLKASFLHIVCGRFCPGTKCEVAGSHRRGLQCRGDAAMVCRGFEARTAAVMLRMGVAEFLGGRGKALVSLGKALKECKEAALWQRSLLHLQEFRRLHEPDAAALDAATIACSRRNRWDLAVFLLRQRWEMEGPSWRSAFNPGCGASISACARAGHWDLALALFAEARVRRQPISDWSCSAAISACMKIASWSRALLILQEVPDAHREGYNAAVAVCAEGRQWQRALRLLEDMQRLCLRPDVFTYSSAVAACRFSWEMAGLILDGMDIAPNILTYCSVMSSYVRAWQWQRALSVFARLARIHRPNAVAYTCAFQALDLAGPEWKDGAWQLVDSMQHDYRQPVDVVSYNAAQQVLNHAEIPMAERTFQREIFEPAVLELEKLTTFGVSSPNPGVKPPDMGSFSRGMLEALLTQGSLLRSAGKVDLKQLITSRRILNQLQPKDKQVEPETKQALAKAMLQAMKEKDAVKLGRVLDAAAEAEVKLPGLEAARRKLAEWRTASPEDSEERSGRTAEVRLRIILPDGRRGWLPVDPEDHGSKVLSSLPQELTASGDMHFFLGLEASPKGAVTLREEVVFSLGRKVGDQPEFLVQGAALCVCPGRHRSSFESGEDRRSDPTSPLWQSVMRAVSEPFPTFAKVEKLLEDTSGWPAVVLAWGGLEDVSVAERSPEAAQAVGACRAIFTGKVETAVLPSLSVPTTSVIVDDTRASSTDIARILGEIEAGGVQRPLLLVVVCRAFLSRSLLQSLRQHLPQDVMLFPCPPATLMRACMEEVPVFESQILEEASRLRSEGVVRLTERCQAALARLQASPEVAVGNAEKKRRVRRSYLSAP
ncbi:unnamed protein product [Symbiodinium sp. CCMP2456]|nr:unnamed protein product [Symbiodinium sp. CCMP2456]